MEEFIQQRSSVIIKLDGKWGKMNLQHRNAPKNNLLKLITNDRVTYDSPQNILKEEVKYFKHMFSFQSPPSPLTEAISFFFY